MANTEDGGQRRVGRTGSEAAPDEQALADDTAAAEGVKERVEKLSDDVDSLLDEIDDVLEENAEEFVRGYVQKGGE